MDTGSKIKFQPDNSVVVEKHARFSLLSDGLVRLEYSPDGVFEDRRSFRAAARPAPTPFVRVSETDGIVTLEGKRITLRYSPDGRPFSAKNLAALDTQTRNTFWKPGQVDKQNLGGVHLSLDCMHRNLIPRGVHPAGMEYHENSGLFQMWQFRAYMEGADQEEAAADRYKTMALGDLVKALPHDALPSKLRELLRERSKFPPGILSRSGYFLYNDSTQAVLNTETGWPEPRRNSNGMDLYLFYYGGDFARALSDYRILFGPAPLIPRYSLGLWYSRFPTFNQSELIEVIDQFDQHDLPLDVLVLDMEWHQRGWYGWDWDRHHIPDPDALLAHLKEKQIHTTVNIHPDRVPIEDSLFREFIRQAGIKLDEHRPADTDTFGEYVISNQEHAAAFMNVLHKPLLDQGIDFCWIDGSCRVAPDSQVEGQFWTNHVYWDHINRRCPERRPVILSRAPGFGAHRYPFHFTGDTYSQWEVLKHVVEYTLRAGHMGQSFVTHDIGGHLSPFLYIDPELYCRWVQFGVLSPLLRLHSSGGSERRPWLYGENVLRSFAAAVRLRMSLVPYLYTLAWESSQKGLPMCRSNCLVLPEWEEGYDIWDAYFLGDRIYAAPILEPGETRPVVLPPGDWYRASTGEMIASTGRETRSLVASPYEAPPYFCRAGSLLVRQPYTLRASVIPETLILDVFPAHKSSHDRFLLYEDDGITRAHERAEYSLTLFEMDEAENGINISIHPAEGAYQGRPTHRNYELHIHGEGSWKALLNGREPVTASAGGTRSPQVQVFVFEHLPPVEEHLLQIRPA